MSTDKCRDTLPGIKVYANNLFHAFVGLSHTIYFSSQNVICFSLARKRKVP